MVGALADAMIAAGIGRQGVGVGRSDVRACHGTS